jgi:crossover junction endodeoxyribonuclease RusA
MVYEFAIAGEPVPQGSMRHVGGGRLIHSKHLIVWRKKVAAAVRSVSDVSIDGPVIIDVLFCLTKPKTVKRDLPTVAPDLDKLQRAIGDALSVDCDFLKDDAQVVEWHSRKIYGDAGVIIRIITT